MIITPFQDLEAEATKIQAFTEITMSEEMAEAVDRGNELMVYIARTGKMLSDARYHLGESMRAEIVSIVKSFYDQRLSATVQNKLVSAVGKKEQHLFDICEQLNKTCKYQLEWCRTIVSKGKEEMRLANIGREFN